MDQTQATTIHASLPAGGHEAIVAGEIYERQLFTTGDIGRLVKTWRIALGTIEDDGPKKGTALVRFLVKREARQ